MIYRREVEGSAKSTVHLILRINKNPHRYRQQAGDYQVHLKKKKNPENWHLNVKIKFFIQILWTSVTRSVLHGLVPWPWRRYLPGYPSLFWAIFHICRHRSWNRWNQSESIWSILFFFVFNLLSKNSSSDGTKHPGLLFCRSVQPSGPGRPTLRDNGNGLSSSGSVYVLEVFAGETAVLPCPPPPSDPPATITFFKDGKPVINNGTTLTSITVFYLFRVELFSFGFYFFSSLSLSAINQWPCDGFILYFVFFYRACETDVVG